MEAVIERLGQDHGTLCDAVATRLSADKLLPDWLGNEMQGSDWMVITSCVIMIIYLNHVGKRHERKNIAGYI